MCLSVSSKNYFNLKLQSQDSYHKNISLDLYYSDFTGSGSCRLNRQNWPFKTD